MANDKEKCLNAGSDDDMTKPIDREYLIALAGQCSTHLNPTEASDVHG